MDAASKRISLILDSFSAEHDDDAKDDIMPSFVFNRASRSLLGSLLGSRRRRAALTAAAANSTNTGVTHQFAGLVDNCDIVTGSLSRYGLDIASLDPLSDLPPPIADLLYFIKSERKCLRNNDDIFSVRTSAIEAKCASIVRAYNEERPFRIENIGVDKRDNVAAAFNAVIAYLQAMPRPLIPFAFMNFILSQDWYSLSSSDDVLALRDDFVERLPLINYRILRKLVATLRQMSIWAYDKQNEEAPVWLVSLFRCQWRAYCIDRETNNAIYVASFLALTIFRSGLGRFSPDNESLFHFRASCFLAQLMLNFTTLFCPKRKKVSSSRAGDLSTDKCSRNEVGYENELVDLRLQQIGALSTHLGRFVELSNQMTSLGDDIANRVGSPASLRARGDAIATRLAALGVDCSGMDDLVVKSSEIVPVFLDKHTLFSRPVSLLNLQTLLFNIRLDTSNHKRAAVMLNLRDYLSLIVNIEAVIYRLIAKKFAETSSAITELLSSVSDLDDLLSRADSVELVYEPTTADDSKVSEVRSPSFLSPLTYRKVELAGEKTEDALSDGCKSDEISFLIMGEAVMQASEKDVRNGNTPSPSSCVNDFVPENVIVNIDPDGDSSFAERTPTPDEIPALMAPQTEANGAVTISSRRSSSGATSGDMSSDPSPRRPTITVIDQEQLAVIVDTVVTTAVIKSETTKASRPSSSSSSTSKIQLPGLHLGSLLSQDQSNSFSRAGSNRSSYSSNGSGSSSLSSRRAKQAQQQLLQQQPITASPRDFYERHPFMPPEYRSSLQRRYLPSMETNV